jgi:NAD-dependent deacetylase
LRNAIAGAESVVALTGAGVSAESGLATFRGPEGLWEGRDPMELATPEAFRADPVAVWRFYDWRREQAAKARPNPAHTALAALERATSEFTLITQNVDGLHERAGSRNVLRLHGSLWLLRCTADGREREDRRASLAPDEDLPPRCECGAALRPGVVWFGEALDIAVLARAESSVRAARLMIVAGTSGLVYPAAALPGVARASGAYVVEINPEATPLTPQVDEHIAAPAGQVLPLLAAAAAAARNADSPRTPPRNDA